MSFQIEGLDPTPFRHLFGAGDADLAAARARRVVADSSPGFPERVLLRDAEIGETLLLVNYVHQPAPTPYRASHAIYVSEGAETPALFMDEAPEVMRRRVVSLRAFDEGHEIIGADLAEGDGIAPAIEALFADPRAAYLHAHYAKFGCFAARVDRA